MLELPDTTDLSLQLRELRIELASRTQTLASKVLPPRQLLIWRLHTEKQLHAAEIARRLNITRSAVHFSLHGQPRYQAGRPVHRGGGSVATLRKHAARNRKIQDVLARIDAVKRDLDSQAWRAEYECNPWSDAYGLCDQAR